MTLPVPFHENVCSNRFNAMITSFVFTLFKNLYRKSESTWAELISAKSVSLMKWLMNQASFRFLISIILAPTHRLLCFGASLCVFNLLLCSPPILFFSIISRGEYKNWIFSLVNNLVKWSFIQPARVKLISWPSLSSRQGSNIVTLLESFQNGCCRPWTKKLSNNSYSRLLRIINALVVLIDSRSDRLTDFSFFFFSFKLKLLIFRRMKTTTIKQRCRKNFIFLVLRSFVYLWNLMRELIHTWQSTYM